MKAIIFLLILFPLAAISGASGVRHIEQTGVTDTYFAIYSADGEFNRDTCDSGSPVVFYKTDFPEGYASLLSAALSAQMGGKGVEMWFVGCQTSPWGGTMPKPNSLFIKN